MPSYHLLYIINPSEKFPQKSLKLDPDYYGLHCMCHYNFITLESKLHY